MKADQGSIVGARIFQFATADSRGFFDALQQVDGEGSRQELPLRASDGNLVPVLATLNRIHLDENQVFCLVVTDLTDQKRQQELLVESRRKDEFLAMLAHELRNPLAPIRYVAESLRSPDVSQSKVDWAREVIDRQVTQLTHLVDDLLDVSRITRGKVTLQLETLAINDVIARAVEAALPFVERRRQELVVRPSPTPLLVKADVTRLAQVVSNLLNNASKFTPEAGQIWLTVEPHEAWLQIVVKDSGVGIEPAFLPEIFNLFSQADASQGRTQGGLGIGLTLVRSLVELHGGTVKGHSDGPGHGSEFTVRLPLAAQGREHDRPKEPNRTQDLPGLPTLAQATPRRILVVDDNIDVAETLSLWLESLGHEVRIAHSGEMALTEACAFRPHVVLMDVGLPGMSGHETARQLRLRPELTGVVLIAVTGYGREEDRELSLAAGFDQHWVKPFPPEALSDLMSKI